jgi:hypothetical protein
LKDVQQYSEGLNIPNTKHFFVGVFQINLFPTGDFVIVVRNGLLFIEVAF